MSIIIDGYNLLHASGIFGRGVGPGGLERARTALLNFLVESLPPADVPGTAVVFDSADAPRDLPRILTYRGLTVHYSSEYESADALIEELIVACSTPKTLIVVSSDHRLHKAAHRRKSVAVDSDRWFAEIVRQRRERNESRPGAVKPKGEVREDEVRYWLAQFDADELEFNADPPAAAPKAKGRDTKPQHQDPPPEADQPETAEKPEASALEVDNPFPEGYADDLFEDER